MITSLVPTALLENIEYLITHKIIDYEYVIFKTTSLSIAEQRYKDFVKNAKEHKLSIHYKLIEVTYKVIQEE